MTTAENSELKPALNRREMLNLAWLASLGFFFVSIGGVTYFFAMPRFREGEFGGLVTVGIPEGLPEPNGTPKYFPKVNFWLSRTSEGVKAIYTVCTHLGCLFDWNDQEEKFLCPCHGSQFERDGTYLQGPAPRDLDYFVVQAVDPETNEVVAETSDDGTPLQINEGRDLILRVDTGRKITGKAHG